MTQADRPRIERVERDGRILWIKRAERLSLRMRVQKGDPLAAFAEERAAHLHFLALGLPLPAIVEDGPDFMVTEDGGPTLRHLLWKENDGFDTALGAAAAGLARFHGAGVTHGRPALKDICWKDGRVTFLDFERAGRGTPDLDLLVFLFSITADSHCDRRLFEHGRDAYLTAGDPAVWEAARTRVRRFRLLALALTPVAWLQPKNREFKAIRPFLRFVLG